MTGGGRGYRPADLSGNVVTPIPARDRAARLSTHTGETKRMKKFGFMVGLLLALPGLARAGEGFAIKDGDRVVFYGDSITDQRLYTTFAETYVVTRFPKRDVTFVHSGWGGDRVTGGGGGPIDVRLERDVIAYKPTVMTIMLGMNDASYQPFKQEIFDTYARGYEHIVEKVKKEVPGIRLTLIVPSPFDDVTRSPVFEGGYNAVLLKYGEFVKELAKKEGATVADLNTSVVEATRKAHEIDPKNAVQLNGDRVHPGLGGQLLMAEALLKAWDAPARRLGRDQGRQRCARPHLRQHRALGPEGRRRRPHLDPARPGVALPDQLPGPRHRARRQGVRRRRGARPAAAGRQGAQGRELFAQDRRRGRGHLQQVPARRRGEPRDPPDPDGEAGGGRPSTHAQA